MRDYKDHIPHEKRIEQLEKEIHDLRCIVMELKGYNRVNSKDTERQFA